MVDFRDKHDTDRIFFANSYNLSNVGLQKVQMIFLMFSFISEVRVTMVTCFKWGYLW